MQKAQEKSNKLWDTIEDLQRKLKLVNDRMNKRQVETR